VKRLPLENLVSWQKLPVFAEIPLWARTFDWTRVYKAYEIDKTMRESITSSAEDVVRSYRTGEA